MFTRNAKPIRITSVRISGVLLCMYKLSVSYAKNKVPVRSVYVVDQQMHKWCFIIYY